MALWGQSPRPLGKLRPGEGEGADGVGGEGPGLRTETRLTQLLSVALEHRLWGAGWPEVPRRWGVLGGPSAPRTDTLQPPSPTSARGSGGLGALGSTHLRLAQPRGGAVATSAGERPRGHCHGRHKCLLPPTAPCPGGTRGCRSLWCAAAGGPTPPQRSPQEQNPFHRPCGWSQPAAGGGVGREGPGSMTMGPAVLCPPPDPPRAGWLDTGSPLPPTSAAHSPPKPQRGASSFWRVPSSGRA